MPNGVDKNLGRIEMGCAVYFERYGAWPSRARLQRIMLWDLARLLDHDDFEQLGRRLELSTGDEIGLLVSGEAGSLQYATHDHDFQNQTLEQAVRWLALSYRREHD